MTRAHAADAGAPASGVGAGVGAWLSLAATPTFAIMAVLTATIGGGAAGMVCSAAPMPVLDGMVPMYLLMSAFHAPPWLRLIFRR